MKILRGDQWNVDFSGPIKLDEDQKKKFFAFLRKELFASVTEEETDEFRSDRIGDKIFGKEWGDPKELALIFNITETNDDLVRKLGRSWMSIDMRRGYLIPQILEEAKKKKVDILKVNLEKFISDFLKEHEKEIIRKREAKKAENRKLREEKEEFERLKEEIPKEEKLIGVPGMNITKESVAAKKARFRELMVSLSKRKEMGEE